MTGELAGYAASESTNPRPKTVTIAVVLAVVIAALESIGLVQVIALIFKRSGRLADGSPAFLLIGAAILGAVVVVALVVGAVLALCGRTSRVLMVASVILFCVAVMSLLNGNFLAIISGVVAFVIFRLMRREESWDYFE